ncbi:MAG: hypothetical protein ACREAA_02555 [Candidatus Polarisedimenticolia bacterium]
MNGATGAAAAAAAIAQAVKASGVMVRVEPAEFSKLLGRNSDALIVHTFGGFFSRRHQYIMGYKGLAFYTSAREPIFVPGTCQVVEAKRMWIPG